MRLLLFIAAVVLGGLGYGYWHASTHASFYVSLEIQGDPETTPLAQVEFLDADGIVLANGVRDEVYSFLHLIHPVHGDCHEVERQAPFSKETRSAWQECFEHQSTWIATWINKVDKVNVEVGDCLIRNHPIAMSEPNSDWYLWWVPHPHIGGKPLSYYGATISVDLKGCS